MPKSAHATAMRLIRDHPPRSTTTATSDDEQQQPDRLELRQQRAEQRRGQARGTAARPRTPTNIGASGRSIANSSTETAAAGDDGERVEPRLENGRARPRSGERA